MSNLGQVLSWARLPAKFWVAWLWFFILLNSYYVLKPIRDANGTVLAKYLNYWYMGSFAASIAVLSIYAFLANRLSPRNLTLVVYQFYTICLIGFIAASYWIPEWPTWLTGAFYLWVSVFNLSVVALFWSVMTDVFAPHESKSWFGLLASAGSVGALTGSGLTVMQSQRWTTTSLLLCSLVGLQVSVGLALLCLFLSKRRGSLESQDEGASSSMRMEPNSNIARPPTLMQGIVHIAGSRFLMGICLFVFLGKFAATYCYNNLQLSLLDSNIALEARTSLFASMNMWTQVGSMILQGICFAVIVQTFGAKGVLAIPCLIMIGLMCGLWLQPTLAILVVAQVTQQIVGYGLMSPGQNLLFTMLSRHDRYVTKGFVDTVLFRFSDVIAGQLCAGIVFLGLSLSTASGLMIPVMIGWLIVSWKLGKTYDRSATLTMPEEQKA